MIEKEKVCKELQMCKKRPFNCRKKHPKWALSLNLCCNYYRTKKCKFGAECKYQHMRYEDVIKQPQLWFDLSQWKEFDDQEGNEEKKNPSPSKKNRIQKNEVQEQLSHQF